MPCVFSFFIFIVLVQRSVSRSKNFLIPLVKLAKVALNYLLLVFLVLVFVFRVSCFLHTGRLTIIDQVCLLLLGRQSNLTDLRRWLDQAELDQ